MTPQTLTPAKRQAVRDAAESWRYGRKAWSGKSVAHFRKVYDLAPEDDPTGYYENMMTGSLVRFMEALGLKYDDDRELAMEMLGDYEILRERTERTREVALWRIIEKRMNDFTDPDIRRNPMKIWRDFGNGYYATKDEPGRWTVHGRRHHLKIQQSEGPTGREDRHGDDYLQTIYIVDPPRGGHTDPVVGDLSGQFEVEPHGFTRLIDAAEWAVELLAKAGA
jgi:hypothetical protein